MTAKLARITTAPAARPRWARVLGLRGARAHRWATTRVLGDGTVELRSACGRAVQHLPGGERLVEPEADGPVCATCAHEARASGLGLGWLEGVEALRDKASR